MKNGIEEGETFESLWKTILQLFYFFVDEEEIREIKKWLNKNDRKKTKNNIDKGGKDEI